MLTWDGGVYSDRSEEVGPGLARKFVDDSSLRARREVLHFIDCALGKATPIINEKEMRADQLIMDGIYAGGTK
jgi:hypothetical protein